jgi:betaine-aldehyde dehydrogenase
VKLDLHAPAGELFIDGAWFAAEGGSIETINPATEQPIREVGWGDASDVDHAVVAARNAANSWAGRSWTERASLLRELARRLRAEAERLALIDTADSGNPLQGSRADVERAAEALEFFAGVGGQASGQTLPGQGDTLTYTERTPYGVVGRILAYNHPLMFVVQSAAAPLVTGNCLVMKPADPTPLSALEVARLTEDLFPPGVFNVVPGEGAVAGHALAAHPDVPRIAFTGSVATGRRVLQAGAEHIKHVTLELGGKNALIVFPDADVDAAATAVIAGMNLTSTNGQSCMSTSRILAHDDLHDALVHACADRLSGLRVGAPHHDSTDVGPLAFQQHLQRVMDYIGRGVEEGARLIVGGGRPQGLERGYYLEPTLFAEVTPTMTIAREEIFGPVISVLRWSDPDDVVQMANATRFGLTANVLTNKLSNALATARELEAGLVWVNGPAGRPPGTPFGGVKFSGLGREHGVEELRSYTQEKSVIVSYATA